MLFIKIRIVEEQRLLKRHLSSDLFIVNLGSAGGNA